MGKFRYFVSNRTLEKENFNEMVKELLLIYSDMRVLEEGTKEFECSKDTHKELEFYIMIRTCYSNKIMVQGDKIYKKVTLSTLRPCLDIDEVVVLSSKLALDSVLAGISPEEVGNLVANTTLLLHGAFLLEGDPKIVCSIVCNDSIEDQFSRSVDVGNYFTDMLPFKEIEQLPKQLRECLVEVGGKENEQE